MFRSYNYQTFEASRLSEKAGLFVNWTGSLIAASNYHCNTRILDDYFMIWIHDGCGEFTSAEKTFRLLPQNFFFLFPGVMHSYKTSKTDLLELSWIGFNGFLSNPLLKELEVHPGNPVLNLSQSQPDLISDRIEAIVSISEQTQSLELSGLLFQLFSTLLENISTAEPETAYDAGKGKAVTRALAYMDRNYTTDISVTDLADFVHMSRSGFSRQFKRETGYSPQTYLIEIRLQQAEYLLSSTMTIKEIARASGFNDEYYFSRCFKKKYSISPHFYRISSKPQSHIKNPDRTWL
ncbi:MAG: AraC family transcriptional regulator [Spirochaetales bacterium]|nr:AraC family transcriptional regulator [Spirochaetales bacterium]